MKHLLRVLPVAFMICFVVPTLTPSVASASPIDQQRDKVEGIVDELERLEQQANQIGEDYVEALDEQSRLGEEIAALEADIAKQEAELLVLQNDLAEMAVRTYIGAGVNPLGPLFEDSDVNDVVQRDQFARVALSAGDVTADDLDAFVRDLEQDREALQDKRGEAEDLAASLVEAQEETDQLTGKYTEARVAAEAELGDLLREEEERRAAESLARIQAELQEAQQRDAQQADSGGSNSGGSDGAGSNNGGSNGDGGSNDDGGSNSGGGSATPDPAPAATPDPAPVATPDPAPSAPPPSSRAGVAVNAALNQQGVPYKYATSSPGVSFDCSGLTKYAWGQAGVSLPHQSRQQYASIPHVDRGSAQPGDLIFFYSPISHVSIYLGNGQHVHAPNTGSVVKVSSVNWNKVVGVGRPG